MATTAAASSSVVPNYLEVPSGRRYQRRRSSSNSKFPQVCVHCLCVEELERAAAAATASDKSNSHESISISSSSSSTSSSTESLDCLKSENLLTVPRLSIPCNLSVVVLNVWFLVLCSSDWRASHVALNLRTWLCGKLTINGRVNAESSQPAYIESIRSLILLSFFYCHWFHLYRHQQSNHRQPMTLSPISPQTQRSLHHHHRHRPW